MTNHDELVAALSECCRCKSFEHYVLDDCVICRAARAMEALVKRAEKAEAEVERLTAALEFYAKEDNWADHFDRNTGASYTPASRDGGAIARSALEAKP